MIKTKKTVAKLKTYNGNINLKRTNQKIDYTKAQMSEYMKCSESVVYFTEHYMKIINLNKGLINFTPYDYQKEMLKSFVDNRFTCVTSSRQSGKSTTTCAFLLWYVLFNPDKTVALLANKGDVAREILQKVRLAYQHLPKWLQQGTVIFNKGDLEFENNSRIIAGSTSTDSIRGYSINCLFIDEAAWIDNWDEFFTSVYPTISSGDETKMILVSTPNGMNHFYKTWQLAKEKKNNFNPIEVSWQRVPGRDEKWKESTLAELNFDYEKFRQEYECNFLGSSGTLIDGKTLKELVHKTAIRQHEGLLQYIDAIPEHIYIIVCDVARGKRLDYSAFQVIDVTKMPYQQVSTYRNNSVGPSDFAEIIFRIAKAYNNAAVLVEINDIGEQVSYILQNDMEYDNVLFSENNGRNGKQLLASYAASSGADKGIRTTKPVKSSGCSMAKLLIEQKQLIINDFETINELSTFSKKNNSYQAEPNAHDDLVMCLHRFTIVETDIGPKTIKWIVDNKYIGKVLSLNHKTNSFEWQNITGYSVKPNKDKTWVQVKGFEGRNRKSLICTSDHKVAFLNNIINPSDKEIKYIDAIELKNKYVIKPPIYKKINSLFNNEQFSVSIGIMLGDGHVTKRGVFSAAHDEKQNDYSLFLQNILNGYISYNKKNQSTVRFPTNGHTILLRELFYVNNKKTIKNVIPYIDDIALAFWYMVDGHLKFPKGCINNTIELCTDCFSYEDHILLQKMFLEKFNIKVSIFPLKPNKWRKEQHYRIRIGTKNSKLFFNLVAPYICKLMRYKLPENYKNYEYHSFNNKPLSFAAKKICEVKILPNNDQYASKLYDIQVNNNHNFIASDILVHNCLILFAWATTQQYFKDLTDINTLASLREKSEEDYNLDLTPFGFISSGTEHITLDNKIKYESDDEFNGGTIDENWDFSYSGPVRYVSWE